MLYQIKRRKKKKNIVHTQAMHDINLSTSRSMTFDIREDFENCSPGLGWGRVARSCPSHAFCSCILPTKIRKISMWYLITEYHCFLSLQETRNYNYKIKYIIYIQRWQLNQSYLFFKTVFQSFAFFLNIITHLGF